MKRKRTSQRDRTKKGDRPARGPFHVLLVFMAALLITIVLLLAWNACQRIDPDRPEPRTRSSSSTPSAAGFVA